MLALSRKKNEALVINNNIEITVLEVKGEQVKLGISAPKEVPVQRCRNRRRTGRWHTLRSTADRRGHVPATYA